MNAKEAEQLNEITDIAIERATHLASLVGVCKEIIADWNCYRQNGFDVTDRADMYTETLTKSLEQIGEGPKGGG